MVLCRKCGVINVKRIVFLLICALFLPILAVTAQAAETDAYARKMLQYYQHYRQEAMPEIQHYLSLMEEENPSQAATWRKVMDCWIWADSEMPVHENVLPDGLPEDDSLCIVVLGYGLTKNGAMKPELLDRLAVAQTSAEKYPNAWILLTGGETAYIPGISEAGEMRSWLVARGVDVERILMDTEAMSTTENARNSCRILSQYPQVDTIAVVTSDYHCRWGASLLSVAAYLEKGENLQVVCSAGCQTDNDGYDSYHSQAWGIALLTGVQWQSESAPELFLPRETIPIETASERIAEPEAQTKEKVPMWNIVGIAALACVAVIFLLRKKKEPLT